ncbi:MAG: GrpB family protein [Halofilum sp. (in: g-proteobacteria)]|nr:GrpB family protein [Halofilum sp. (in: g-proteobacteria)]
MTDAVHIQAYDPAWPRRFREEAARVRAVTGGREIEHHGSTAVAGMPAKPVIDMMVAITSIAEGEDLAARLQARGYEPVDASYRELMPERIVLVRRDGDGNRRCHVHLLLRDHAMWTRQIRFRDRLRADAETARAYAELKRALARRHGRDRHAYMMAKAAFIARVTDAVEAGDTAPAAARGEEAG